MKDLFRLTETKYGFQWGPASVVRICDDPKAGVLIAVYTDRARLEIRVTPSGLIRICDCGTTKAKMEK